jgi:hypothetical protein
MEPETSETPRTVDPNAIEVARIAHEELRRLLQDRATVTQRIEEIKRTLSGIATIFGEHVFKEDLIQFLGRRKSRDQPGLTAAWRKALLEANGPMLTSEVCDRLLKNKPSPLSHHKNPFASVSTVMNRLVKYGEVRKVTKNSRVAWEPAGSAVQFV